MHQLKRMRVLVEMICQLSQILLPWRLIRILYKETPKKIVQVAPVAILTPHPVIQNLKAHLLVKQMVPGTQLKQVHQWYTLNLVAVASILEQKKTDLKDPYDCLNGDAEQNFSSVVTSNELNRHQEEECDPHDWPVSPDKLYRAAILRSRFADIIIKVQENNLEKGETPGTRKVKGEREELERWRREEKARLQPEAKALEEDRIRDEVKAEAEVRRKRELEREAARQALQKMEKTVDINENSQFLEDLDMFRSAPDEHLQSSLVEDASPVNSQNGLDSFKFQASGNPLEQLGLFMKSDEDKEVEQQSTPSTSIYRLEEEMD